MRPSRETRTGHAGDQPVRKSWAGAIWHQLAAISGGEHEVQNITRAMAASLIITMMSLNNFGYAQPKTSLRGTWSGQGDQSLVDRRCAVRRWLNHPVGRHRDRWGQGNADGASDAGRPPGGRRLPRVQQFGLGQQVCALETLSGRKSIVLRAGWKE